MFFRAKKHPHTLSDFLKLLRANEVLILILAVHTFLRIPNLFEPYWYGDEGIYLTIGTALRQGRHLYADIVDHKTPLIYYFAMVPNQLWFRILNLTWMTGSIVLFYAIARKLLSNRYVVYAVTALFMLLTSLPALEGHIPNGELFVIGWVCLGVWLLFQSEFVEHLLAREKTKAILRPQLQKRDLRLFFLSGLAFSGGILTKVPAVFDAGGVALGVALLMSWPLNFKKMLHQARQTVSIWVLLSIGILIPILLSIVYYFLRGTLAAYIDFGLLYNFRYAGSWSLPPMPKILQFGFSLPGKGMILIAMTVFLFLGRKHIQPKVRLVAIWTVAALFGALLSSRPYPHYLLQVIPPLVLLFGVLVEGHRQKRTLLEWGAMLTPIGLLFASLLLLQFKGYEIGKYYREFGKYLTKQSTRQEYFQSFSHLMDDTYAAAEILRTTDEEVTFIYGNNPMLYALSHKRPIGRFIVNFHIRDFRGAFDETYALLAEQPPEFVVMMKDDDVSGNSIPAFIMENYLPYEDMEYMTVYKRFKQP